MNLGKSFGDVSCPTDADQAEGTGPPREQR